MLTNNSRFKKAFSLIELSIVILIIGIFIVGVIQGTKLYYSFKLKTAQAFSQVSDVNSIPDLVLWFDAVRDSVLTNTNNSTQIEDGDYIKNWKETNPQQRVALNFTQSTAGTYPVYLAQGINGLPTLSFDGVDDNMAIASDPRINEMNNFGIFVVVNLTSNSYTDSSTNQGILTKQNGSTADGIVIGNAPYLLHFGSSARYLYAGIRQDNSTAIDTTAYSLATTLLRPYSMVVTMTHDSANYLDSQALRLYVNSTLRQSSTGVRYVANLLSSLKIGQQKDSFVDRFATCYISEIIIFNRNLNVEERLAVERYLGKKWGIKVAQ